MQPSWQHGLCLQESMRVLDLGCGFGLDPACWGVRASDEVTGIDVDERKLEVARQRFPSARIWTPRENDCHSPIIVSIA